MSMPPKPCPECGYLVPDGASQCPRCKLFVGAQNRVAIAPKTAGITTPAQKVAAWVIVTLVLLSFLFLTTLVVVSTRLSREQTSPETPKKLHKISVGMTEDQVMDIEGSPRLMELEYPYPGSKETYDVWVYEEFSVHFHKGRATVIELR